MIIKNDAREIEKELNLDEGTCRHLGNFIFKAEKKGTPVIIDTKPADETQDQIRVLSVHFA